jgi:hypothetical protein
MAFERPLNRMASTVRRGRPTDQSLNERALFYPTEVQLAPIVAPPIMGIVCPLCKVAMVPPAGVIRNGERFTNCAKCWQRIAIGLDENHNPITIRTI